SRHSVCSSGVHSGAAPFGSPAGAWAAATDTAPKSAAVTSARIPGARIRAGGRISMDHLRGRYPCKDRTPGGLGKPDRLGQEPTTGGRPAAEANAEPTGARACVELGGY